MNPMSLLSGGVGGGISSSATATSGDAKGQSATGDKNISFGGGNPNTAGGVLSNPVVLMAIVAAVYLIVKK